MYKNIIVFFAIFLSKMCCGQINLDSIANSILDEGMYLYKLEKHSMLASGKVLNDKKNIEIINGYLTYNKEDTTITIFYNYSENKTDVIFEFKSLKDSDSYSNSKLNTLLHSPDAHEYKLIKAREEIIKIITETPSIVSLLNIVDYNIAFHEKDSFIECYLMAGFNIDSIVPIGADFRIDLSNDYKIIDIEYYHARFIGEKRLLMNDVTETKHRHIVGDSKYIAPTEVCIYKLYDCKFQNTKKHIIDGENYTSIFDSENNTLKIISSKEYYRTLMKNLHNK